MSSNRDCQALVPYFSLVRVVSSMLAPPESTVLSSPSTAPYSRVQISCKPTILLRLIPRHLPLPLCLSHPRHFVRDLQSWYTGSLSVDGHHRPSLRASCRPSTTLLPRPSTPPVSCRGVRRDKGAPYSLPVDDPHFLSCARYTSRIPPSGESSLFSLLRTLYVRTEGHRCG